MARAHALVLVGCCACGSSPPVIPTGDARMIDATTAPAAHLVAYVSGYGPDIAWHDVDPATGALSPVGAIPAFAASPSFLAVSGSHLYAVSESQSRVGAYAIEPATGALTFINDVDAGGSGPAHISVDRGGHFALVANYDGGSVSVLAIRPDGGLDAPRQTLSVGANAHMILTDPSNHFVFVPCKGADRIAQLTFDPATGALAPNPVPQLTTAAGAGPRHLAFAPDGRHAYLINENASTLTALAYDGATGRLSALQTVSTLPANATGSNTGAEVWVHPSGKFVYGSNRGHDSIVTFAIAPTTGLLTLAGHTPTGGATPRDFTLDPAGARLYVANQDSDNVVPFAIDPVTGVPAPSTQPVAATTPSFVGIVALPAR
jgi:6-phosphogluconolactonase